MHLPEQHDDQRPVNEPHPHQKKPIGLSSGAKVIEREGLEGNHVVRQPRQSNPSPTPATPRRRRLTPVALPAAVLHPLPFILTPIEIYSIHSLLISSLTNSQTQVKKLKVIKKRTEVYYSTTCHQKVKN
jgi:hypothetical protein